MGESRWLLPRVCSGLDVKTVKHFPSALSLLQIDKQNGEVLVHKMYMYLVLDISTYSSKHTPLEKKKDFLI